MSCPQCSIAHEPLAIRLLPWFPADRVVCKDSHCFLAEKEVEARSHLLLEQDVAGIGISELDALIARLQAGPSWDLQATR